MFKSDPSLTAKEVFGNAPFTVNGKFQSTEGENVNEMTRELTAKFGKRYTDIVRQYGAYELILDKEVRTRKAAGVLDS